MFFSKRKYIKELNKQIKQTSKLLKSYTCSVSSLVSEKERLKSLSGLTVEGRKNQFDFVDRKIKYTMNCRDKCSNDLKCLKEDHERVVRK